MPPILVLVLARVLAGDPRFLATVAFGMVGGRRAAWHRHFDDWRSQGADPAAWLEHEGQIARYWGAAVLYAGCW
jgi:hypothetical protein